MRPILPLLFLAACKASSPETSLEVAFCDQLAADPVRSVTAVSNGDGPELVVPEGAVDIDLVEDAGQYTGLASYTPDETGSFAIGLSDDVPIVFKDASGTEIPFTVEVAGSCDSMAVRYTLPLEIATYTVEFGPTDVPMLSFVSEESDDDL